MLVFQQHGAYGMDKLYIYLVGGLPNLQTNADSHGLVIYHDQSSSVRNPSIIPLYLLADTDFPLGFFESLKTLG